MVTGRYCWIVQVLALIFMHLLYVLIHITSMMVTGRYCWIVLNW